MNTTLAAPAAPSTAPAEAPIRDDPTSWEVDDALWTDLQPLLVVDKPRKKPGRPREDDRRLFNGLIWLARTGAQWAALPARYGPKSTAHARMVEWVEYGGLAAAWALLLRRYDREIGRQWEWQAADGRIVKAPPGEKGIPASRRPRGPTRPTAASAAASATC
jgi:transposase